MQGYTPVQYMINIIIVTDLFSKGHAIAVGLRLEIIVLPHWTAALGSLPAAAIGFYNTPMEFPGGYIASMVVSAVLMGGEMKDAFFGVSFFHEKFVFRR